MTPQPTKMAQQMTETLPLIESGISPTESDSTSQTNKRREIKQFNKDAAQMG